MAVQLHSEREGERNYNLTTKEVTTKQKCNLQLTQLPCDTIQCDCPRLQKPPPETPADLPATQPACSLHPGLPQIDTGASYSPNKRQGRGHEANGGWHGWAFGKHLNQLWLFALNLQSVCAAEAWVLWLKKRHVIRLKNNVRASLTCIFGQGFFVCVGHWPNLLQHKPTAPALPCFKSKAAYTSKSSTAPPGLRSRHRPHMFQTRCVVGTWSPATKPRSLHELLDAATGKGHEPWRSTRTSGRAVKRYANAIIAL